MFNLTKKLLIVLFWCNTLVIATPYPDEQREALAKEVKAFWSKESSRHKQFEYPVSDPSQLFDLYQSDRIPIFSYGSLLNKESAARSMSEEAMATHKPAIAFGMKRIFNRHVPTTKRWGPLERPNDTAMLNVNKTEDFGQIVNGVLITVSLEDLKNLIDREEGYDLVPVVVRDWNEGYGSPRYMIAYTFQASNEPRLDIQYTRGDINPVPGYAHASMEGAAQYGEQFLSVWLSSTYLADRETSFTLWLADPEIDCIDGDRCH